MPVAVVVSVLLVVLLIAALLYAKRRQKMGRVAMMQNSEPTVMYANPVYEPRQPTYLVPLASGAGPAQDRYDVPEFADNREYLVPVPVPPPARYADLGNQHVVYDADNGAQPAAGPAGQHEYLVPVASSAHTPVSYADLQQQHVVYAPEASGSQPPANEYLVPVASASAAPIQYTGLAGQHAVYAPEPAPPGNVYESTAPRAATAAAVYDLASTSSGAVAPANRPAYDTASSSPAIYASLTETSDL